jgi:hypothetical protein
VFEIFFPATTSKEGMVGEVEGVVEAEEAGEENLVRILIVRLRRLGMVGEGYV